ncbi:hypothetical protein NUSPORA_01071 [Nucleospora cyclopteri]
MLARVERLCQNKLNGRNLFKAVNEHAIFLDNYYIGVLKLEPDDFARLDDEIRFILTKNNFISNLAAKNDFISLEPRWVGDYAQF